MPTTEIVTNPAMLSFALDILGATAMPHNLYLHSPIVQTRAYGDTIPEKRQALRFATRDIRIALMFALRINASILILVAARFHATGQIVAAALGLAHRLLGPLLGFAVVPPVMFRTDRRKMGAMFAPGWLAAFAVLIGVVIVGFNLKLLWDFTGSALS